MSIYDPLSFILHIFTPFIGHPQHRCWAPSRHSHHRSCLGAAKQSLLHIGTHLLMRQGGFNVLPSSEWWVDLRLWIGNGNINSPCHHFVGFQPTPFQMCASPQFTSMQGFTMILLIFTTIASKTSLNFLCIFLGTPCLCRQTPFNISMRITHGQHSTILAQVTLFGASKGGRSKPKTSSHTHLNPNEKR